MEVKQSLVTVFRQPWTDLYSFKQREEWFRERLEGFCYKSGLQGEEAAEECFHITNCPECCLTEDQKALLKNLEFQGPSVSVGDIIRVTPIVQKVSSKYFMCKSMGWEQFTGDVIQLLKFLKF